MLKDIGTNLKGLRLAKSGTICASKRMNIINGKIAINKIYEFIRIFKKKLTTIGGNF